MTDPASRSRTVIALSIVTLLGVAALKVVHGTESALASSVDLRILHRAVTRLVAGDVAFREYAVNYPPSSLAILAAVLAPWPVEVLKPLWAITNWGMWVAGVFALVRINFHQFSTAIQTALLLVGIAMRPVHHAIGNGQVTVLAVGGVIGALLLAQRDRWVLAGLLLAIGLVKPSLSIPFLAIFAVRHEWRVLALATACHVLLTLSVSGWLMIPPWVLIEDWMSGATLSLSRGNVGTVDLGAAVSRLGWPEGLKHPLSLSYLVAAWAFVWSCRRSRDLTLLGVLGIVSLTWTYHRLYDHVTIVFAVLAVAYALLSGGSGWAVKRRLALGVTCLAVILPANLPPFWSTAHYLVFWTGVVTVLLVAVGWLAWTDQANNSSGRPGRWFSGNRNRTATRRPRPRRPVIRSASRRAQASGAGVSACAARYVAI